MYDGQRKKINWRLGQMTSATLTRLIEKPAMEMWSYPLFELMSREHGLTLVESELDEIIDCVRKLPSHRDPDRPIRSLLAKATPADLRAALELALDRLASISSPYGTSSDPRQMAKDAIGEVERMLRE